MLDPVDTSSKKKAAVDIDVPYLNSLNALLVSVPSPPFIVAYIHTLLHSVFVT
jgi:hypothetical protein